MSKIIPPDLLARLKKNLKIRQRLRSTWPTTAYRLYDRDLPNYPYIIDHYDSCFVIWFKGKNRYQDDSLKDQHIADALKELFEVDDQQLFFKRRSPQKRFEKYQKHDDQKVVLSVQEGNCQFEVNLTDYLDTGLFLDHRPLRREVFKICQKLERPHFLNLFCYTGSVSISAAMAGAITTNVDLSNNYLEWAKINFALNKLNPHDHLFYAQSATDLTPLKGQRFDLIYIDPPTFSNSKKTQDFDVQLHHRELLEDVSALLKDKGIIYFSCNKRDFIIAPELSKTFVIKDWTRPSIPEDFRDQGIHHCFILTLK